MNREIQPSMCSFVLGFLKENAFFRSFNIANLNNIDSSWEISDNTQLLCLRPIYYELVYRFYRNRKPHQTTHIPGPSLDKLLP